MFQSTALGINSCFSFGDVNGDGIDDMALYSLGSSELFLGSAQGWVPVFSSQAINAVTTGLVTDVNLDSQAEWIFAQTGQWQSISVDLNNVELQVVAATKVQTTQKINAMEPADINGDGLPDLVTLGDDYVRVWLNQGGGNFDAPRHIYAGEGAQGNRVFEQPGQPAELYSIRPAGSGDDLLLNRLSN